MRGSGRTWMARLAYGCTCAAARNTDPPIIRNARAGASTQTMCCRRCTSPSCGRYSRSSPAQTASRPNLLMIDPSARPKRRRLGLHDQRRIFFSGEWEARRNPRSPSVRVMVRTSIPSSAAASVSAPAASVSSSGERTGRLRAKRTAVALAACHRRHGDATDSAATAAARVRADILDSV
jgi:hypothetical protein